jgi:hypothetical protein
VLRNVLAGLAGTAPAAKVPVAKGPVAIHEEAGTTESPVATKAVLTVGKRVVRKVGLKVGKSVVLKVGQRVGQRVVLKVGQRVGRADGWMAGPRALTRLRLRRERAGQ